MALVKDDQNDNARALAKLLSVFDIPTTSSPALLSSYLATSTTSSSLSANTCNQLPHSLLTDPIDPQPQPQPQPQTDLPSTTHDTQLGSLASPSGSQHDLLQWNLQPTRSGRIPQRPDPNSTFINPLDFLDFPTDSESDDPDFQPPPHSMTKSQEPEREQEPPEPSSITQPSVPAVDWAQQLLGASGLSTADLLSHFGRYSAIENQASSLARPRPTNSPAPTFDLDFDFSTLTASPPSSWAPDPALASNPQFKLSRANSRPSRPAPAPGPSSSSSRAPPLLPTKRPSPLTAGSLAGIPFVQISLPDSDDSPEFVPPPSKRSRRDVPSPDPFCSPTRHSVSSHHHEQGPSRPLPPAHRPPSIRTQVSTPCEQAAIPESPCESIADSDISRPLNKNGIPRAKPGPKPRPKPSVIPEAEREDVMRRKREGMRAVRVRKKEYVEELEDQCRFLQSENARLREENEQLMRESRENWKARALALSHHPSPSTTVTTSSPRRIAGKVVRAIAPNTQSRTVLDVIAKRSRTTVSRRA
ncbi:hypothetical protein CROQUDRAFT_652867 [Cronartium quercuum f. sp. fusiforme G11]|uniref:BZIP domain-containing protein n=1 Tax=Cronartium quercuum f. sp. fusiforme G11 TaxID=708437 RepID=A0A9P6NML0_9BASI|nr:hypothetical protein CROQUDRAFT_652867 [Cronartium quercuum f. sp. fusiforme G11]